MTLRSIGEKPFRVCLFGTSTPTAEGLASLKGATLLAHAGDWTQVPPDSMRVDAPASDDPLDVLPSFARAFPRETLILVRSDAVLPTHAFDRLLRAIEFDHVLGAAALDDSSFGVAADRDGSERIDALCFAYGARRLVDASLRHAAVSAWHGERLAELGHASPADADALAAHGLRCVVLDHLHVRSSATTTRAHRNAIRAIRRRPRLSRRCASGSSLRCRVGATPDRPGLDARPVLLHVLHGWGGGAERWVRDFASAFAGACHLVLISRGSFTRRRHGEWLELHDGALSGPPLARVPLPVPIADTAIADGAYRDIVAGIVRDACVDAIVVSSLIGHSLDVLATRLPTFTVIHDHYPLWPTLHRDFGDAKLRFDDAQRAQDLAALGADAEFANRDPKHWRALRDATVATLRSAGATMVAPSRSALANHLRLAPELAELPQHVIAHGLAPWRASTPTERMPHSPLPLAGDGSGEGKLASPLRALAVGTERQRPRLLVPGRVRRGKGAELLIAALDTLREHADLYLVGAGADARALFGERNVHIVLDYERDALPALVARIAPDAALLLPTVAETFSYTLSELRSLGVPVIATRVGALAERIRDGVDGFLLEPDATAANARIAALLADRAALDAVRDALASHRESTLAEMAAAYARVLALGSRPAARYPLAFADAASFGDAVRAETIARLDARTHTLGDELAATRAESDRRGEWGHALDRELGERTRWAQALDTELGDLRPRHAQVIGSTSWRITAPLRRWNARLAGVRAALAFRTTHMRATLARVRGSLAQRGFAGTLARIAAELRGKGPVRARVTYAAPRDDFARFAVPTSATPRVSIVIPVYNKIVYTSACLRSLAEYAGAIPFEVIVVDDGSSDRDAGAARRRRRHPRAAQRRESRLRRFVQRRRRRGEGRARAVPQQRHARDGRLARSARALPRRSAERGSRRREAHLSGRTAAGSRRHRVQRRIGLELRPLRRSGRSALRVPARSRLLLRRRDPAAHRSFPAARRLRHALRAGVLRRHRPRVRGARGRLQGLLRAGVDRRALRGHHVRHRHLDRHQAFPADQPREVPRQVDSSHSHGKPAPGTPVAIASSHRATKRVLIVDATTPTPDQDSGSLRMVNLMRVLGDLGCRTTFLPDNRLWVERYTPALQALGVEALYAPWTADPVKFFRERGAEFDAIVLSRHYVAASYLGLARLYAPRAKLIFDTVDLHYLREQRAYELEKQAGARAPRGRDARAGAEADPRVRTSTLVVSDVEQTLLATDAPEARVEIVSNVHEVYGCRRPFAERRDLVFVGGFQHPPNTDAVVWFVRDVFPLVRAKLPDVEVPRDRQQGAGPDHSRSPTTHVIVHGYVEDIAPYMDGCRVSVAPLRYGAGVKGKVNMAMSYGLPVVATPAAVEGMHVESRRRRAWLRPMRAAFADAVVRVYEDEALWNASVGAWARQRAPAFFVRRRTRSAPPRSSDLRYSRAFAHLRAERPIGHANPTTPFHGSRLSGFDAEAVCILIRSPFSTAVYPRLR